jgi:hypothetical protein
MPRMTLDVEELLVESFDTGSKEGKACSLTHGGWSDDSICPTVTDFGRCCPP